MTEFEKQFLQHCLDHILESLNDPQKFNTGAQLMSNSKSDTRPITVANSTPIKVLEKIPNSKEWQESEAGGFTFAVLNATALVSYNLAKTIKQKNEANSAIDKLINEYVPSLTANTSTVNRINDLKVNIARLKEQIANEPTLSVAATAYGSFAENPLMFFAKGALAAAVFVGVAALKGMSPSSNE